ncbi:MAG TPA: hypothetical protein PKE30_13690, partial [Niabella sp.]|nr:hypothetical protein [Niabella sp.]
MKLYNISVIFLLLCSAGYSQNIKISPGLKSLIPAGWIPESQYQGDLNKDKLEDIVLVLRNTDRKNFVKHDGAGTDTLDLNPRRLMILFKTGTGYKKVLATDKFLPSVNSEINPCLDDPLFDGGIEVKNGILKIRHHYWLSCGSWYVTDYEYTFRYQNNKFELIGLDINSFHRASGESGFTSYNFSTRKKQVITGINE